MSCVFSGASRSVLSVFFVSAASLALLFLASAAVAADKSSPLDEDVALERALEHVHANLDVLGLNVSDASELRVSDLYSSRHNGVTHVYLQQQHQGIDIFNALVNVNILPDGQVLNMGNRAYGNLVNHELTTTPVVSAHEALETALRAASLSADESIVVLDSPSGRNRKTMFSTAGVAKEPMVAKHGPCA